MANLLMVDWLQTAGRAALGNPADRARLAAAAGGLLKQGDAVIRSNAEKVGVILGSTFGDQAAVALARGAQTGEARSVAILAEEAGFSLSRIKAAAVNAGGTVVALGALLAYLVFRRVSR